MTSQNYSIHPPQDSKLSRHVASVISHFTASPQGYSRLAQQVNILHLVSPDLQILFSNDGRNFSTLAQLVHPLDLPMMAAAIESAIAGLEFMVYCRYTSTNHLMQVKTLIQVLGQPRLVDGALEYVVLAAREYSPIAPMSFDAIVQARILNLRLKKTLAGLGATTSSSGISSDYTTGQIDQSINASVTKLFCRECGKSDSPEWRKGPLGAKTYTCLTQALQRLRPSIL